LFLTQYLIEAADGLVELASEPLGTLGIRLTGKLARAAGAARSGSALGTPGRAAIAAFSGRAAGAACHCGFRAATGRLGGIVRGRTTAPEALACLAHATDATRERTAVAAIAATLAVAVIRVTVRGFGTVVARAAAHAGHTARHRHLDLRHAADAAGRAGTAARSARTG
jgi:hypothetical protein